MRGSARSGLVWAALVSACAGSEGSGSEARGDDSFAPDTPASRGGDPVFSEPEGAPGTPEGVTPEPEDVLPSPSVAGPGPSGSEETRPALPVGPQDEVLLGGEPEGESSGCERQIVFEAVELSDPPPFDVVIVADHSDSLSWSRDDLSAGLSQLLANVRGAEARFFILTPTQYGASSSDAENLANGNELVNWSDPLSGTAYEDAMTEYLRTCKDAAGAEIACPTYPAFSQAFSLEGRWEFQMPPPVAEITPTTSEQELAEQQTAISDAILGFLGSGSLQEQPLCTLNRYLAQPQESLPKNAIFIVLSDEDDVTSPEECLVSHSYENVEVPSIAIQVGCTSGCDAYRYRALAPRPGYDLNYTCVPQDDQGNTFPEQATSGTFVTNHSEDCPTEPRAFECRPADISRIEEVCGSDVLIEACEVVCTPNGSSTGCWMELPESIDACNQPFELESVEYANMLAYCTEQFQTNAWESCELIDGYWVIEDHTSFDQNASIEAITAGKETSDLVAHFETTAARVFATGKHFVEVIGFDPRFACELRDGQSYATTLSTLASTPEDVFPICESYAPALARIERFAGTLLDSEYGFALSELEEIEAVRVTDRSGQERELRAEDYSYDAESQTLRLEPAAIGPNDVSLSVEVAINCIPKAR